MAYTYSSSFTYTPDVVDLEAMNITETFPEASSYDFDISASYNHSYSDSISGIPLSQQALWDDGQLSHPPTANQSRIYPAPTSASSSANNSANNSINLGHFPARHLLQVPSPHQGGRQYQTYGQAHVRIPSQLQGSPLRGDYGYTDSESGSRDYSGGGSGGGQHSFDEYEESSLQNGWVDETRDHNGLMLLNDKEHQDEQHLLFLQDIGASANISRGDSISLFAKLGDGSGSARLTRDRTGVPEFDPHVASILQVESHGGIQGTRPPCDLFKEELDADDSRDQSKLQFEYGDASLENPPLLANTSPSTNGMNNNNNRNEIFSQEFMASLKAPLVSQPPPPLESADRRNNILEGLHTIPAAAATSSLTEEEIRETVKQQGRHEGNEAYERARRSFLDSLKIADPITTPHKFAPQPLPILWNEPKIRSKGLPSFNLADYKDAAKVTSPASTRSLSSVIAELNIKRDSISASSTNTPSVLNAAHSSPRSSVTTSLKDAKSRDNLLTTPKTPTAATYLTAAENISNNNLPDSKQELADRSRRTSTIQNPHLAFDPTITPAEREIMAKVQARAEDLNEDDESQTTGSVRRMKGSIATTGISTNVNDGGSGT
ncbi:hypothetical protein BGZ98_004933, partial [Dissophora globulifera]